jgi:hypothetical protein
MVKRFVVAILAGLLLTGCTDADWNGALSYVGLDQPEQREQQRAPQAQAPAPPARTTASDDWCREVAKAALESSAENDFDAATQQHRAQASYEQCVKYAGASPR